MKMVFEVFYNSVENSGKEYANDIELYKGLQEDFEYDIPMTCKVLESVFGEEQEYVDNDITVTRRYPAKSIQEELKIGDYVKIPCAESMCDSGVIENPTAISIISSNYNRIYQIIKIDKNLDAPYFLDCIGDETSFYAHELERINYVWEYSLEVSEESLDGTFETSSYYKLVSEHRPTAKEINDLIFEALEIEQIHSGKVLLNSTLTLNGDYVDGEQGAVFEVEVNLSDIPSKYIDWSKCKSLPYIYAIDRENSHITLCD